MFACRSSYHSQCEMKQESQLYLDLLWLSIDNRLVDWCIEIIYFKGSNIAKYVLGLIFFHSVTSLIKSFDIFSYLHENNQQNHLIIKSQNWGHLYLEWILCWKCINWFHFMILKHIDHPRIRFHMIQILNGIISKNHLIMLMPNCVANHFFRNT